MTFVINGDGVGPHRARAAPPGCPTCASPATSPTSGSARCSPPATSTSCRCAPGSATSACRPRRTRSSPPAARSSPSIDLDSEVPRLLAARRRRRRRPARRPGSVRPALAAVARRSGPRGGDGRCRAAVGRAGRLAGGRRRGVRPPAGGWRPAGPGRSRRALTSPIASPSWHDRRRPRRPPSWRKRARARKVRFQGGTVFPAVIAAVLVLGFATDRLQPPVAGPRPTARRRPSTTTGTPRTASTCATRWPSWYQLRETRTSETPRGTSSVSNPSTRPHRRAQPRRRRHALAPVHGRAIGKNAELGVFLDTYDVELTARARLPRGPADPDAIGRLGCAGVRRRALRGRRDAVQRRGRRAARAGVGQLHRHRRRHTYIANMDEIHIDTTTMVFGIYFSPTTSRSRCRPGPPAPASSAVDRPGQHRAGGDPQCRAATPVPRRPRRVRRALDPRQRGDDARCHGGERSTHHAGETPGDDTGHRHARSG